jgi:hypothetical protein
VLEFDSYVMCIIVGDGHTTNGHGGSWHSLGLTFAVVDHSFTQITRSHFGSISLNFDLASIGRAEDGFLPRAGLPVANERTHFLQPAQNCAADKHLSWHVDGIFRPHGSDHRGGLAERDHPFGFFRLARSFLQAARSRSDWGNPHTPAGQYGNWHGEVDAEGDNPYGLCGTRCGRRSGAPCVEVFTRYKQLIGWVRCRGRHKQRVLSPP